MRCNAVVLSLLVLGFLGIVEAGQFCVPAGGLGSNCPPEFKNFYSRPDSYAVCAQKGCQPAGSEGSQKCAGRVYDANTLKNWGPCNNVPTAPPSDGPMPSPTTPPTKPSPTKPPTKPGPGPKPDPSPVPSPTASPMMPVMEEWSGLLIASWFFSIVAIIIGIAGIAFLVKFWNRPVVVMSQKVILVLICVGVIAVNIGITLLIGGQKTPSSGNCMGASVLVEPGLTLLIACIGVKEWRAWKVRFNSINFKKVKITDGFIYGIIAVAVLITYIIVITGFVQTPTIPDPSSDYMCTFGSSFLVWFGYLIFLNVLAIVLAIMTRDVPSVAGESSSILHVSFFTLFAMVILAIAFFVDSLGADLKIFLMTFVVFWISLCYMFLIIFRKFAWINHSAQEIKALFLGDKHDCTHYTTGAGSSGASSESAPPSTRMSTTKMETERAEQTIDIQPAARASEIRASDLASMQRFGESTRSDATVAVDFCEADERRKTAFLIATADGWEEYVDRQTGESFWIHTATGKLVDTAPASFVVEGIVVEA